MEPRVRQIVLSFALLLLAYTVWCMTAHGFLERPYLDPASSHFDAGAGDVTLIARAGLSFVLTILLLAVTFIPPFNRWALISLTLGLLLLPLFAFSAVGLQRWAPNYSEESFRAILKRKNDGGGAITKSEVIALIGDPIVKGSRVEGDEIWCYSYMPSCGFGWDKRVLCFRGDRVTNAYAMNEP